MNDEPAETILGFWDAQHRHRRKDDPSGPQDTICHLHHRKGDDIYPLEQDRRKTPKRRKGDE